MNANNPQPQKPFGEKPIGETPLVPGAATPFAGPPVAQGPGTPPPVTPVYGQISFDAITEAWNLFARCFGLWLAAMVLFVVLCLVPLVLIPVVVAATAGGNNGQVVVAVLLMVLAFGACACAGYSGMVNMAVAQVHTGQASLGEFGRGMLMSPRLGLVYIIMFLAIAGGMVLCVIPGILLGALLMFAPHLALDKNSNPLAALNESMNALRPQLGMALCFMVVVNLLSGAGSAACYIGMLLTVPLANLATAVAYRDVFRRNSPGLDQGANPVMPIADPYR